TSTQRAQTPAVNPADVRVTVLNGTGVTGLASRVLGELTAAGYPEGAAADAGDSARTVTVVEYRNGREAYARAVARTLGLSDDAIDAIQPSSETACAAPTGSCTADVVVTVGADRQ
ncbi:MAG TPA: LytR C-terminal domain-containing protein, partial [Conexibacter sp.]|nr:LytR C-terminal domain-containing protein [Conexibacter sp.]